MGSVPTYWGGATPALFEGDIGEILVGIKNRAIRGPLEQKKFDPCFPYNRFMKMRSGIKRLLEIL